MPAYFLDALPARTAGSLMSSSRRLIVHHLDAVIDIRDRLFGVAGGPAASTIATINSAAQAAAQTPGGMCIHEPLGGL